MSQDKRKHPRLDLDCPVKYKVPEQLEISIASLKNISGGGLAFMSEKHVEAGSTIEMEFALPGDSEPCVARGEVRWSETMEESEGRFTHRVGVEFIEISEKRRQAITGFIVNRLRSQVNREIRDEKPPINRRLSMLVVDDDRVVLKLIEEIFKDSFNVITARDGYAGIEKAREWRPDIILLDIVMPDLDGFSTLMLLKDFPETANIPVIMLSVLRQKSKIFQAVQHGAHDYALKPFTAESLLRKIRKVLGESVLNQP